MEPPAKHWLRPLALLPAAAVFLSTCKLYLPETDDDGEDEVTFAIQQTPHETVAAVDLQIEALELERANGDIHEIDVSADTDPVRLLPRDSATNPQALFVFREQSLPVGDYERLSLILADSGNEVVPLSDDPVHLVSAGEDGRLDFESAFTLGNDGPEELILTIDLQASLREAEGSYELGTEHFITTGSTSGILRFPDFPFCDDPARRGIYFFEGEGQDPSSQGSRDALWFRLWIEQGRSDLRVPYLSSGKYTVAYTCQMESSEPEHVGELEFEVTENLEIDDGRCSFLDFGAGPGEPGTC